MSKILSQVILAACPSLLATEREPPESLLPSYSVVANCAPDMTLLLTDLHGIHVHTCAFMYAMQVMYMYACIHLRTMYRTPSTWKLQEEKPRNSVPKDEKRVAWAIA